MGNRRLIALALLGVALWAISATVTLTSSSTPHPGAWAGIGSSIGAILLGVGFYAWRRGGQGRFGQVLVVTGLLWFGATLSSSDGELLYSVGRLCGWLFEVALIYAVVSYPTGRLESGGARVLAYGSALLVAVLYLPAAPFVEQFPLPTVYTGCVDTCPPNAFFSGSEPGLVDDLVRPLRELLTIGVFASVAGLLAVRLHRAGRNLKRTLVPVLGAALLRFAAAGAYVALRRAGADEGVLDVARFLALLPIPLTALGFLVGLLQWRVYSAGALAKLTTGMVVARSPAEIEALLARSLDEPQVALLHAPSSAGTWLDASGRQAAVPAAGTTSLVTEARAESGLRVAIVCDSGFAAYPGFLDAVCSCVVSSLERQRLDAALAESLAGVAASRKRLAGAADEARRRIERDLHDGAQQQLVALRVRLGLLGEAVERGDDDVSAMLEGLGGEVELIIDEVRSLARGIYPPLLASDGLGEALRAAGRRCLLPVAVEAEELGRLPSAVESAIYFCCLEAMQNAAKHARGAKRIGIGLRGGGELRFEVADDGCGFRVAAEGNGEGSGITGMRDRLAAVGGELRIDSWPGRGTLVRGSLRPDWLAARQDVGTTPTGVRAPWP